MQWSQVVADPNLRDLPFKVELDEYGKILMTPHSIEHSLLQGDIEAELRRQLPEGRVAPEFAIRTAKGTKAADVVWGSAQRFVEIRRFGSDDAQVAPEICIEILYKSNTLAEMEEKRDLYLTAGAIEFWLCDQDGRIQFFDSNGQHEGSRIAPGFPQRISTGSN